MIWLVRDFDLLAVLLHAATLSLEAIVLGGIFFLLGITPSTTAQDPACLTVDSRCRRLLCWAAAAMALAELMSMGVSALVMLQGSGLGLHDLFSATFLRAEIVSVASSSLLAILARTRVKPMGMLPVGLLLVTSTVRSQPPLSRVWTIVCCWRY